MRLTTPVTLMLAIAAVTGLAVVSLFIGVADINSFDEFWSLVFLTRLPRTLAVILTGLSLSVAGVVMQSLARNKFVEPTTTGTVEWAALGILLLLLFWPQASMTTKLIVASLFSLIGASSFLFILSRIQLQSSLIIPLAGIMYAGVISSVLAFIAYRFDLMQSVWTWIQGDFSMILKGRYELLWISAALCGLAYFTADQFTLASMGKHTALNLGLNYRFTLFWGVSIVAMISGITVVISGIIPFVGLVVPNIVSLLFGDNYRRTLPWVAVIGTGLVLTCDILARVLAFPYEIPVATVMGVIGSIIFLILIHKQNQHA
ncbi:ABC transporter permease [Reinekea marinisedimentorum]|uniref:Iron complex transport system permease protein n=1 Tax=Reinekea marinisedimentorum TaxID=230495 RepID=A0A4R3HV67_9GAMM|nr:iron chelate uptake ABC transporter family permease subunit [Reinekea marinisedimentorum]TCS36403.1 iron complex transport system permease protein [Reinekea marinisedimentorum]